MEGLGRGEEGVRAVGGTEQRERDKDMRLAYTQLERKLMKVGGRKAGGRGKSGWGTSTE